MSSYMVVFQTDKAGSQSEFRLEKKRPAKFKKARGAHICVCLGKSFNTTPLDVYSPPTIADNSLRND